MIAKKKPTSSKIVKKDNSSRAAPQCVCHVRVGIRPTSVRYAKDHNLVTVYNVQMDTSCRLPLNPALPVVPIARSVKQMQSVCNVQRDSTSIKEPSTAISKLSATRHVHLEPCPLFHPYTTLTRTSLHRKS